MRAEQLDVAVVTRLIKSRRDRPPAPARGAPRRARSRRRDLAVRAPARRAARTPPPRGRARGNDRRGSARAPPRRVPAARAPGCRARHARPRRRDPAPCRRTEPPAAIERSQPSARKPANATAANPALERVAHAHETERDQRDPGWATAPPDHSSRSSPASVSSTPSPAAEAIASTVSRPGPECGDQARLRRHRTRRIVAEHREHVGRTPHRRAPPRSARGTRAPSGDRRRRGPRARDDRAVAPRRPCSGRRPLRRLDHDGGSRHGGDQAIAPDEHAALERAFHARSRSSSAPAPAIVAASS